MYANRAFYMRGPHSCVRHITLYGFRSEAGDVFWFILSDIERAGRYRQSNALYTCTKFMLRRAIDAPTTSVALRRPSRLSTRLGRRIENHQGLVSDGRSRNLW